MKKLVIAQKNNDLKVLSFYNKDGEKDVMCHDMGSSMILWGI